MGLSLRGQTSGAIDINAPNVAGNNTITLPGSNGAANQFYKNSGTAGTLTHSSMIEDSSGNIGVGGNVITDLNRLNIQGSSAIVNIGVVFNDTNTSKIYGIQNGGSALKVFDYTTSDERMRIDSVGRLLVGTTTASQNANRLSGNKIALVGTGLNYPSTIITSYATANADAGPIIEMQKSRGETDGSMTVVADNDRLGNLQFLGSDGTNFIRGSAIAGYVDGTPGTNDMPGRLTFSTTADGESSPTERMRINSSGKVQSNNWSVDGQGTTTASNVYMGMYAPGANAIAFATLGTEKMQLDSSGRLLIGTSGVTDSFPKLVVEGRGVSGTEPAQVHLRRSEAAASITSGENIGFIVFTDNEDKQFAVIGCTADANAGSSDYPGRLTFSTTSDGASSPTERMRIRNNGQSFQFSDSSFVFRTVRTGTSNALLSFQSGATTIENGTQTCRILADGDLENANNSYGALSDVKLKENIVDASSQWNDIKSLQVRKYNFKESTGFGTHTQIGVVAQEIEIISPGLVTDTSDLDNDGNDLGTVTKTVNYSVLYMKAVKALQEAMERIETLETQNADLLARVTALEG